MRLIAQFAFFLFLLICGIYLGTQNAIQVDINFFGSTYSQKPIWMVMLLSFGVGALVSLIFCSFEIVRTWRRIFILKRQLKNRNEDPDESFQDGEERIEGEISESSDKID